MFGIFKKKKKKAHIEHTENNHSVETDTVHHKTPQVTLGLLINMMFMSLEEIRAATGNSHWDGKKSAYRKASTGDSDPEHLVWEETVL